MGRPLNSKTPSFWTLFKLYPPIIVRLRARRRENRGARVCPLSKEEIAITSGIRLSRVMEISESFDWDEITMGEAERFCHACNFDPSNADHRQTLRAFLRLCLLKRPNRPPHHLQHSPLWRTELLPLIQRLKSLPKSLEDSEPSASRTTMSAA